MANKIILKKSSVSGKSPSTGDLEYGELALNYADGKLYYKTSAGTIDYISTGGSGGGSSGNVDIGASFLTRTYTGDGTTTGFSITNGCTVDSLIVTENGIVQTPGTDYTVAGSAITFTTAPADDVHIQIRELFTGPSLESLAVSSFSEIGDGLTDTYTLPVTPTSIAHTIVNVGGVVQIRDAAYTLDGSDIVFAEAVPDDQPIDVTIFQIVTSAITDLVVSGESNLGNISNVTITGGTSGQVITTDGAGNLSFTTVEAGGADLENSTTDDLDEGVANLYFTTPRARNSISVTGSLNYNSSTGVISYNQPTGLSAFTNDAGYLQNYTETDPLFTSSAAYGITSINISNWDNAYAWGNHALEGYLTTETDPVFVASPAYGITNTKITNWDTAYGWGDHSQAGYITTETDPVFVASAAYTITSGHLSNWNTAYDWGNHASAGYATETYVNTAVANLVDSAPEALDTLNELAAALGDDANFATTVATSIGTKLATADFNSTADTWLVTKSTTNLAEGTNLYYTDTRARAAFTAGDGIDITAGVISALSSGGSSVTVSETAPANPEDGDLWFGTTTLDLYIYFAAESQWIQVNSLSVGAAVTISDTAPVDPVDGELWFENVTDNVLYVYDESVADWVVAGGAPGLELTDLSATTATGITYNNTTGVFELASIPNSSLANNSITVNGSAVSLGSSVTLDTDDVSEGSTNLYYTDTRANSAFDTRLALKSTSDLSEGTNLYYTDTRANTAIDARVDKTFVDALNVDADTLDGLDSTAFATAAQGLLADSATQPGDNISTLTNDAGFATETYVNTAVANLVDSAPSTLDTLNELAAALGDDANFATTVTTSIGTKLATADFSSTADTWLGTKTTTNLAEGTSLYYTDARVGAYLSANSFATESYVTTAISGKADLASLADVATSGDYTDLINTPTIPSDLTDLGITDGTTGQVLTTDGAGNFSFTTVSGGGGGASVTVSETAPSDPADGDLWFDPSSLFLFIYYTDNDSSQWIQVNAGGGGGGGAEYTSGLGIDITDNVISLANPYVEVTDTYTAEVGKKLFVDCSAAAITVTLPASPVMGDEVTIVDASGTAETNNITIGRNGNPIAGASEDLTIDVNETSVTLAYYNATRGWLVINRTSPVANDAIHPFLLSGA